MKFHIKKGSVEARKVVALGVPFKQDDPLHGDIGKIPVEYDTRVTATLKNEADEEYTKVVAEFLPAGSTVKVGDYLVGDRIVDGPFLESIAATKEE